MKKHKPSFLILLIIIISFCSFGQPAIQWQKCYGGSHEEFPNIIKPLSDGTFIVIARTTSNDGDVSGNHSVPPARDAWFLRLDSSGNIVSQNCIGYTGYDGVGDILESTDGGFYICGGTSKPGCHGLSDAWLAKLDSAGNILWDNCYGGSGYEGFDEFKRTVDGGFILVGATTSDDGDVVGYHQNTSNYADYWIVKVDSIGNFQWQKCMGGSRADLATTVHCKSDGGYFVGGSTSSVDGDLPAGTVGYWIVELDSLGNRLGDYFIGRTFPGVAIFGMKPTPDSGFVFSAVCRDSFMYSNFWIAKTDGLFNIEWENCLGGSKDEMPYAEVCLTSDGGYALAGFTASNDGDVSGNHSWMGVDVWVTKLDSTRNIQWQKCIGGTGEEHAYSIIQTQDNGFFVAAATYSTDGDAFGGGYHGGIRDVWIVKLGPDPLTTPVITNTPNDFFVYLKNKTLHMELFSNETEQAEFQLIDIRGSVIIQKSVEITPGNNKLHVPIGAISKGIYLVRLIADSGIVTRKLFVE